MSRCDQGDFGVRMNHVCSYGRVNETLTDSIVTVVLYNSKLSDTKIKELAENDG